MGNRTKGRRYVIAGTAILTIAIIGPLLRPGTLLLLDWVPGPRPQLSSQFWGFPPGPTNGAPIEAMAWTIGHILPWGFIHLWPLALAPALAAWGFSKLFADEWLAVLASTLFLIVNPFMYERMLAGHLYFVLGISLIPLLVAYLFDEEGRTVIKTGLLLATLVSLSVHFVFIAGVIVVTVVVMESARKRRRRFALSAASVGVVGLLSVYWIIPALFGSGASLRLSTAHLAAFRTTPDARLGLLPNVLGLYGFWRKEWPLPKQHFPTWPLLLAAILLVVLVGFSGLYRQRPHRAIATTLAISAIVGTLLALGDQGPTGSAFRWLFVHFPGFAAMREPQKFLALLVVGYATGFGWGVKVLVEQAGSHRGRAAAATVLLLLPAVYGFREFWGFAGWARPASAPASWAQADRVMGSGGGKVLALPWHQYVKTPWSQGRVLANPMSSYFRRDVLWSHDPEVPGIRGVNEDEVQQFLNRVVAWKGHSTHLGRTLSSVGVEYVLLAKYSSYQTYSWLREQKDLQLVREWPDLVLLKNDVQSPTNNGVNVEHVSPVRYEVRGRPTSGPLVTTVTPGRGWTYRGKTSAADRLTAVFPVQNVVPGTIRYQPWQVTRLAYMLGLVMTAIASAILARKSRNGNLGVEQ